MPVTMRNVRLPKSAPNPTKDLNKRFQEDGEVIGKLAVRLVRDQIDEKLNKRPTGKLRKSWKYKVERIESGVKIHVFSGSKYARIHDLGGVIRPKRVKFLTIPMTPSARRAGSPRRFRSKLFYRPWGFVDKRGKTQYVFKKQVQIFPRFYATKAREQTIRAVRRYLKASTR